MQIRDRFKTRYYRCKKCWSLQLLGLEWLKDAYWGDTSIRYDEGRRLRNRTVYTFVDHIRSLILRDKNQTKVLDYGSGQEGLLKFFLKKFGRDLYKVDNYDPYVEKFAELPNDKYDVIVCVEVLEHLHNVQAFFDDIKRLAHSNSIIVCSTEIHVPFGPHANNKGWRYLTPEIGQHITFWTRRSLAHMRRAIGAKKCAVVGFPNRMLLRPMVFCLGGSVEFLATTHYKIAEL